MGANDPAIRQSCDKLAQRYIQVARILRDIQCRERHLYTLGDDRPDPSFSALLDQEPYDAERSDGINPPGTGDGLNGCQFPLKGSASIRVIAVRFDGWNGDWADVA